MTIFHKSCPVRGSLPCIYSQCGWYDEKCEECGILGIATSLNRLLKIKVKGRRP